MMQKVAFLLVLPLLACQGASATEVTGSTALALASLVAQSSPVLRPSDQKVMAALFNGNVKVAAPKNNIYIGADSIICRAGNVDLTLHSCDLTFAKKTITVKGRAGHELFATVAEAGVVPEGAAGSSYEALSQLSCAIDVHQVEQQTGGGADCKFDPGPPR